MRHFSNKETLQMSWLSVATMSRDTSSASCGTNSNWDFCLIWIGTEQFWFLDLVDFGGVAISVESVTWNVRLKQKPQKKMELMICGLPLIKKDFKIEMLFFFGEEKVRKKLPLMPCGQPLLCTCFFWCVGNQNVCPHMSICTCAHTYTHEYAHAHIHTLT